jgi:hypothetical protein
MKTYKFETNQFGISEAGIHLLRSRFNYETIAYKDIDEIRIERGRQVNNWVILLVLGWSFLIAGSVFGYKLLYEFFLGNSVSVFYFEQFLVPVIPIMLGVYMVGSSLKVGWNIKVITKDRSKSLSIEEIKKKTELNEFLNFLKGFDLTKNKIRIKDESIYFLSLPIQDRTRPL